MKVVFDTNVWLSAIFWDGEANKLVKKSIDKKIEILVSKDVLSEVVYVLNSEQKFQNFLENRKQSIENIVKGIILVSNLIGIRTKLDLIKEHPKDNIILELAFDGKADFIVSYDKHILNMLEFREIRILKPEEFMKMLK